MSLTTLTPFLPLFLVDFIDGVMGAPKKSGTFAVPDFLWLRAMETISGRALK